MRNVAERDLQTSNQAARNPVAPQVAPAASPGVTALNAKLAQGSPKPEQISELLAQFPHDRDAMLEELQQKMGNGFTQQVVDTEANGGKLGWWSKLKRGAGATGTVLAELAAMGMSVNVFTGTAVGTIDLPSAMRVAEMFGVSLPVIMLGGVPKSSNKVIVEIKAYSMEATIAAPSLQIAGVMTGTLNAGACTITGLTAHLSKHDYSATFQKAHFEHATFIRGGEHLTAADFEMTNVRAINAGARTSLAFGAAHVHGLKYPNVPPVDFDLPAGADFNAVFAHEASATAAPKPAGAPEALPEAPDVLPKGAQIKVELVAPKGNVNGATGGGAFERLKAAVVQGPTELASIEIDGFSGSGGGANASASIRQILIHGDPSLVKQLLANPQVAGNASVKAALDLAKSSGLDPAIGGRIAATNITANHSANGDEVTGDFDGTIEVPQLGTLQLKVDGLAGGAQQGMTQAQVAFKTLSLTLRDKANKDLAFLELDGGIGSMKGDKRAGQVKKLAAHGDVAKLVTASESIVKHAPVDIRGALTAVKALGLKGDITGDLAATSDAKGVHFAGDFDADLAMDTAGHVKIHVGGLSGNDQGELDFGSFTASLTDTKGKQAASISVADAHSMPAAKGNDHTTRVGKITAKGEDATVHAMVNSIEKKATTLPEPVKAAFTMVRRFYANAGGTLTLDQVAMGEDKAGNTTAKAQDVHGVFSLHGAGTATVALHGFNGTASASQDRFSFTSFDAVLNDAQGKRAAHVRVEGSHDSFVTKGKAAGDFALDAKSLHVDGESQAAAALFEGIRTHLDTMPKPIAATFKMIEQYAGSITAAGTIDVANMSVTSKAGAIGGKGTIEGHIAVAGDMLDAKLVNARGEKDALAFDALELSLKTKQGQVAASLHVANVNANVAAKTAQLGNIAIHGDAAKLKAALDPSLARQLPPQIGQVLGMIDGSALDVAATDVAVGPDRAGAKTLSATGTIRVHDQGNHVYTARGAQLELDGANIQMDRQGKPHEIDARSIQIRGEFTSAGGDALHGHAVVTTGAAKIVLDATGAPVSVDVKGIRASGDGERTAAPAAKPAAPQPKPTRDEKLAALNGEMATAESVAQAIQTADIRAHIPLFAGRYGRGFKSLGVPAGAAINIALEVRNNALTNETSVKIQPALDLPLWLTGKGVDLETKGRQGALELRLGGFFDQNITKYVVGKGPLTLDLPGLVEQVAGHMRQGILEAGDEPEPTARDQQKAQRQAADDQKWLDHEHADWQKDHDRDAARGDQKRLAKDAGKEPRSANIADFATKGLDLPKTQATADVAFAKPDGTVSGHVHGSATGGGRLHLTADALNAKTAAGNVNVTGLDTGVVNVAPDASSIELQGLSISEFKYAK